LETPDCFWSPESPVTQHQKHELYNPEDEPLGEQSGESS
jgi:hypothetical protein